MGTVTSHTREYPMRAWDILIFNFPVLHSLCYSCLFFLFLSMPYFWKNFLSFSFLPHAFSVSFLISLFFIFYFFLLFQSCSAFGCVWGSVICIFFFSFAVQRRQGRRKLLWDDSPTARLNIPPSASGRLCLYC